MPLHPPAHPFDLIWNFVTFLWYVILPPVFFSLLLAIKTLWNSQNKEGQRTSCETALCSQWVCWGRKPTSEVIEGRSRKGSRQVQPWILKKKKIAGDTPQDWEFSHKLTLSVRSGLPTYFNLLWASTSHPGNHWKITFKLSYRYKIQVKEFISLMI